MVEESWHWDLLSHRIEPRPRASTFTPPYADTGHTKSGWEGHMLLQPRVFRTSLKRTTDQDSAVAERTLFVPRRVRLLCLSLYGIN